MARIVIVGAGISGLTAALEASASPHEVVLLEGSPQIGGKLRLATIAGHQVDVGAESMLARRPEALELLADLDVEPVHPAAVSASIWTRDALRPMPKGTMLGVPADASDLESLLNPAELERARDERVVEVTGDLSVGDLVESALGPAVVDRLVEPLLGGVYAGHARRLSAAAAAPALLTAARHERPLTEAARSAMANASTSGAPRPVFASLRGGVGSLPKHLVRLLLDRGVTVRTGATARELVRTAGRWQVTVGETRAPEHINADAVILATPARATSRLLSAASPDAANALAEIGYASMGIVTYAFRRTESDVFTGSSGFLVPPIDERRIKASTFSSSKWPWLADTAPDLTFVRVSIGRHHEEADLQKSDAELAAAGMSDLRAALGDVPRPVAAHVQRWGGALPQYAVGHLDRIAGVRAGLTSLPGLEVAGAAYEGVGIPACIGTGRKAAGAVLTHLADR
ncbi:protoporphyrinogen oxidase [Flexivirga endophytica]|uniref:Coproporphyrinogen III oxidase n=1 Tax=Flexivirga endophytica TaxID=1849103 RepID=A0A916SZD9_9MICO|nr:protoporphyrinogen oxidase [Flexivirga endophytica]GGB21276.1 protoporphyrinogen oxidase [Flexivirga endophytica]GHB58969.1 protoporphyrinogen oxidase [Flexivirga endophytica]